MRAVLGILVIVGTFLVALRYLTMDFSGYLNIYAAILLAGLPLGVVILSYRGSALANAFRGALESLRFRPEEERLRLGELVLSFGREVRRGQAGRASAILEKAENGTLRSLGRRVLEGQGREALEAHARIQVERSLAKRRDAESVLVTLGETAPAVGMIGTVIGLIQLLANMRDFEKLGSGMAIALLTTFYGLILAHLFYLPLARLVAQQAARHAENMQLVLDGLIRVAERRPLHELQEVVGVESSSLDAAA